MDAKTRQRLAISHRVLDAIRSKEFRSDTLANHVGEHVIMSALPDDTLGSFFEEVRRTDGPVHIATLHGEDLLVVALGPFKSARHARPAPVETFPMGPDVAIGILIDYLILREKPILIREVTPQMRAELVERPDEAELKAHCGRH